jgi:hypothetical protein
MLLFGATCTPTRAQHPATTSHCVCTTPTLALTCLSQSVSIYILSGLGVQPQDATHGAGGRPDQTVRGPMPIPAHTDRLEPSVAGNTTHLSLQCHQCGQQPEQLSPSLFKSVLQLKQSPLMLARQPALPCARHSQSNRKYSLRPSFKTPKVSHSRDKSQVPPQHT